MHNADCGRTLFYDDPGIDEGFADALGRDAEPDPRAVLDAGRDAECDGLEGRQIADPGTLDAPVVPDLAPAAAPRARPAHRHAERDRRPPERFVRRDDDEAFW